MPRLKEQTTYYTIKIQNKTMSKRIDFYASIMITVILIVLWKRKNNGPSFMCHFNELAQEFSTLTYPHTAEVHVTLPRCMSHSHQYEWLRQRLVAVGFQFENLLPPTQLSHSYQNKRILEKWKQTDNFTLNKIF